MQTKTNYQPLQKLCERMGIPCEFEQTENQEPYMLVTGQTVTGLVEMADSMKGRMLISMLGK